MEIINIEKNTFDEMQSRLEQFRNKVNALCNSHHNNPNKQLDNWLDNQDVCMRLNISKRTLQTLRDNGKIAYSKINNKIFYKVADVEKFLQLNHSSSNQQ